MNKPLQRAVLTLVACVATASAAWCESVEAPTPHLYFSPTAGFWRWDGDAVPVGSIDSILRPVYGGRIGYAPFEALSAELVILTGTNEVSHLGDDEDLQLTQAELSFVVNFRSLFEARWYPFVDLGGGVSFRSSDAKDGDDLLFDGNHVNFHLGGGVKIDLAPRAALRFNVRDTFFTETRTVRNQEVQATTDAVEFSVGLDYRIPFSAKRKPKRLR